ADRPAGTQGWPAGDGDRVFKKSLAAFQGASPASRRQWQRHLYQQIRPAAQAGAAVSGLCRAAGVSRAGYYRFLLRPQVPEPAMDLRSQIQRIALRWPAYGYRRVHAELLRHGWSLNHKRILRLMRADN